MSKHVSEILPIGVFGAVMCTAFIQPQHRSYFLFRQSGLRACVREFNLTLAVRPAVVVSVSLSVALSNSELQPYNLLQGMSGLTVSLRCHLHAESPVGPWAQCYQRRKGHVGFIH